MTTPSLHPDSRMSEVTGAYPGAQRALFRQYHIGGCNQCAFSPEETLRQLCERNGGLDPQEVLARIQASHEEDARTFIAPRDLKSAMDDGRTLRLLDIRSRPEHEAVRIEGAVLMTQKTTRDIMAYWKPEDMLVIVDHQGRHALDAAAYFAGHGLKNVRCLLGGIDAWSREVDPTVRRYALG